MKTKTLYCLNCNKTFTFPDTKCNLNRHYCGNWCASSANGKRNKGRKHSKEVCKHFSKIRKGNGNPFYSKKHSKITKELISKANSRSKKIPLTINDEQLSVLDGLMLSDGHLNANNVSGRYSQGCKYKEFLEHIKSILPFSWGPIWHDQKWNYYHVKSHFNPTLLKYRKRWYSKRKKVVPRDLEMTGLTLLYWFLGDGSIRFPNKSKFPRSRHFEVKLATDSFSKKDNMFLISKLNDIGIKASLLGRNQIRILSKSNPKFFKLMGNSPVKCYGYKWRGYNGKYQT